MHLKVQSENLIGNEHLVDIIVAGNIILKLILKKHCMFARARARVCVCVCVCVFICVPVKVLTYWIRKVQDGEHCYAVGMIG